MAFDEDLSDLLRPVSHLLREEAAVKPDEFVGQFLRQRLIGVPGCPLVEEFLGHVGVVVLVCRVEQNQAGNLARVPLRVVTCVEAAKGMTDHHVRSGHLSDIQQRSQFVDHLHRCAGQIDPVAPPGSGAVIDHAGGKCSGPLLNVEVVEADCASSGQKHDRRAAATRLVQQQPPAGYLVVVPQGRRRVSSHTGCAFERFMLHRSFHHRSQV